MNRLLADIWILMTLLVKTQNEEHRREKPYCLRECLNHKLMIGRTDSNSTSGKGSEGNEKHIIGNWKIEKSCYIMAEGLAEL